MSKNTREKAGALNAKLLAAYNAATEAASVSAAAYTDCTKKEKKDKTSGDCENLKDEMVNDKAVLAAAKTASIHSATYFKDNYPVKTGATAGIIVGCIAATICIGYGAYSFHSERKEADRIRKAEDDAVNGTGGAMDMDMTEAMMAPEPETGLNFYNDDCYTAMVDTE
jgi:hypothetical protein